MKEHTSSSAFATDLLAGNWASIGGAGYSNVIMDTLYEGDVPITSGDICHTLDSSANNYDYVICTVKITYTGGLYSLATTVVPAHQSSSFSMGWTYGVGATSAARAYGWINFNTNNGVILGLWEKGSNVSSVSLERVHGFKVT